MAEAQVATKSPQKQKPAAKPKKVDKAAEAKARKIQFETFGDNDKFARGYYKHALPR